MTDKEKRELKDGIISIFKNFNILDHTATIGGLCNDIFGYIDSMQEEPVSEDLEKAANEWDAKASFTPFYMALDDKGNPYEVRQDYTTHAESFKAGAKWGRNQAMAEIQAQSMAIAHGCPKEYITEDLEEAAKNHGAERYRATRDMVLAEKCKWSFKAGAEWQKQQTISKACKWIDENAARYLVDRFVGSTRVVGIDTSITEDFRKDMGDE